MRYITHSVVYLCWDRTSTAVAVCCM